MKIRISISTNTGYTGEHGLYSAVEPTPESVEAITKLCKLAGFEGLEDDLHCTLMYSPDATIPEDVALKYSQEDYIADVKGFNWWAGHDNDGYLVLELDSAELSAENNRFRAAGAKPTFEEYRPHITLKNKFWFKNDSDRKYALKNGNMVIRKNPLEVTLVNQKIEDIKGS